MCSTRGYLEQRDAATRTIIFAKSDLSADEKLATIKKILLATDPQSIDAVFTELSASRRDIPGSPTSVGHTIIEEAERDMAEDGIVPPAETYPFDPFVLNFDEELHLEPDDPLAESVVAESPDTGPTIKPGYDPTRDVVLKTGPDSPAEQKLEWRNPDAGSPGIFGIRCPTG